jgi:DNA polymerase-3 subunit gamma/tau
VVESAGPRTNKHFTLSELKNYWVQYAERFKSEGRTSEYIILNNRDLQVDEHYSIKLPLDNLVQIDQLNEFKAELLDYLRRSLSNHQIMLETTVIEKQVDRKPYSQTEKFQHLAERYPIVAELKKRLGLDMDY